jgi:hypothetical protein
LLRYIASSGKVANYGTEPLVDEAGLGEDDAAASSTQAKFLALWIGVDAAGSVTT